MAKTPAKGAKSVETLVHEEARRPNIPTAELQSTADYLEELHPTAPVRYPRARPLPQGERRARDADLDPQIVWNGARIRLNPAQVRQLVDTGEVEVGDAQLVWRGKDAQDWSDLVVQAPPLYIQEKVHPKAIINDLKRRGAPPSDDAPDLFSAFNGLDAEARAEFYAHENHWSNRMILGDSLQVMASLAEREALRGKVQCIYFDPPYGIKFNSNWQVSTQSRDVKDGKMTDLSREPEQVKAFRDTWKDGVHSYLTYLRDRLSVARDLLTESGSIFVQIGDENVHRVRGVMDEVFGADNFVSQISVAKTAGATNEFIAGVTDHILWSCKNKDFIKYRSLYRLKEVGGIGGGQYTLVQDSEFARRRITREEQSNPALIQSSGRIYRLDNITSQSVGRDKGEGAASWFPVFIKGKTLRPSEKVRWKTNELGMRRLLAAERLEAVGNTLTYVRFIDDFRVFPHNNLWTDTGASGFSDEKVYVVQTLTRIAERCILMATDPGDLVLDPTCGSGTTATVAEQWGRRWITIDTSRVALALARTRLMSARYPYYLLADSPEGRRREQEVSGVAQPLAASHGDVRQGFVYERAPHVTLKSIANNAEIDVIWEKWQAVLEPLRADLNMALGTAFEEWEVPRELPGWIGSSKDGSTVEEAVARSRANDRTLPEQEESARYWHAWLKGRQVMLQAINRDYVASDRSDPNRLPLDEVNENWIQGRFIPACDRINRALGTDFTWQKVPDDLTRWLLTDGPDVVKRLHARWWEGRIARQREIDASIARAADVEMLYDRPYEDKGRVRVAGPFTVESLSPHRTVAPDDGASEGDELIDELDAAEGKRRRRKGAFSPVDWAEVVLENLRSAGVHSTEKRDSIRFDALTPWPGEYVGAEGRFSEGEAVRRAAIFIGPEFGTLSRPDLVAAAREATEARFDVLIACAFNFDAHASELTRLGPLPILKAKMNPDLHMAEDLKNTGKGNLFVVFGEPDIDVEDAGDGHIRVRVKGVDVFDPNTGDIRSSDTKGIAAWFVDTDYDEESFFVRHAYFLGAGDPYKSLKTALRAEIDDAAWATLYRDVSRPFPRPNTGRIAVKVINHFGDEVMKVFPV